MKSLALWVVLCVPCGCAHTSEDKQLDTMREEIDHLRDSRDRADHMPAGGDTASAGLVVPPAYASAPAPPPPSPPVVQLGEPGSDAERSGESTDPQDTTPRPTIRIFGSSRSGRNGWHDDQVEQTSPDEGTTPPSSAHDPPALDPEAKRAYDGAIALVNAKRFDEALEAFAHFLVKWPDHPYAINALYWRGECYFARADYAHAAEQFEGAIARFPAGSKVPDSLYKLGLSYQKLGNPLKAKECFDRLTQQFPDSDAAHRSLAAHSSTPATPASSATQEHH